MKKSLFLLLTFILLVLASCQNRSEWELVWSDEFGYSGTPDQAFWDFEKGKIRNRELQYYTGEEKNVRVEDGHCLITAVREGEDSLTSASIHTRGKVDFLYGRVEVRAQIPSALGTWPAIWMLGTNKGEVRWPACGEIDIMEHVGYDPDVIHANIHTKAYNHIKDTNKGDQIRIKDPWAGFHVYAVEWYEDRLDFFLDDSLYFSYKNDMKGDPDTWPFHKPHYLLINLAFGGTWGGRQGVDFNALPLEYRVDYVRYYKQK